jgi:hypothetical protein
MSYLRFAMMIAVSTAAMFGLMYLNTYALDHVLHRMYPKPRWNLAIFAGAGAVFALGLWLVRSQTTVDDVAYMKAMIPHHSIAIMTSRRARITDPRVRELADGIIASQEREIAEMKALVGELEARH